MDSGKRTAFLFIASAVVLLAWPTGVRAGCCCPSMWASFGEHCYRFFSYSMNWNDAEMFCRNFSVPSLGKGETVIDSLGHLVSIHSQAEHDFVVALFDSSRYKQDVVYMWIGLSDISTEGRFKWTDGTHLDFTIWATHQPSNSGGTEDCGLIVPEYGNKWNDGTCSRILKSFMCRLPIW